MSTILCDVPERALCDPSLSRLALRVLLAIGKHSDRQGRSWASQETLGELCGIGRRRASQAIKELVESRYVAILGRRNRACLYQLGPGPTSCAPRGRTKAAPETEKNLPQGAHDPARGGGAQTPREPSSPPNPPFAGGADRCDADAPHGVSGVGPPDGGRMTGADAPDGGVVEARDPPGRAQRARQGGGGANAVPKSAKSRRNGNPSMQGARRSPLQFALPQLSRDEGRNLTILAMDIGEEAALIQFGFDKTGRKPCATPAGSTAAPRMNSSGAAANGATTARAGPTTKTPSMRKSVSPAPPRT